MSVFCDSVLFRSLLSCVIAKGLSFAFWKNPCQEHFSLAAGLGAMKKIESIQDNQFVVCDFENIHHFIIDPVLLIRDGQKVFDTMLIMKEVSVNQPGEINYYYDSFVVDDSSKASKSFYIELVKKAASQLDPKGFSKVVLARKKIIDLDHGFDPFNFFIKLTENYNDAFIYLLSSPQTGTWVGASPELMLESSEGLIQTVAIAGTRSEKQLKKNIEFTEKEKTEQEIVSGHIRECFVSQNAIFEESLPSMIRAGNLYHIKTSFSSNAKNINIFKYINDLHPSPAVSGYPKGESIKYILEQEDLPRKFYSGFLGPYYGRNDFHFFVNLRCMEIKRNNAILYAGAGILKDSDPEAEWQETENKIQTLLGLM